MKTITFKQKQKKASQLWLTLAFAAFGFSFLQAQVQNNGKLYINDGGTFFVKGSFAFGTSSTTASSRTTTTFGKLLFDATATSSGATTGAGEFVDGFASTLKTTTAFELPTGQNNIYAPIRVTNAALTNGVAAAYYAAAPAAVGSTLAASIVTLPTAGYWEIKGDNSIITMLWNSNISAMSNSIANLTVAGYNTTTSKWEAIASGTPTGSLTSGTIATSAAVTLTNYSAFTLAKRGVTCADLVAASVNTRTWNGSAWDNITGPSLADAAILSGNYPSSAGSFQCNSLAIGTNTISLTNGQTIEVVNGITGSGTITMSSQASILQRNDGSTITPSISLTKSTARNMNALDYIYLGSPLTSNSFSQLGNARAFNKITNIASGAIGAFDLKYKYVSGDTGGTGGWQTLTTTAPGVGFIMRIAQQAPFATIQTPNTTDRIDLTFTGAANNGVVTSTVAVVTGDDTSSRNNNLLANPYPSAIDSDKFLEVNTNLDGAVYLWNAQTSNTGTANAVYNTSDYIARTRAGSTKYGGIGTTDFGGVIATGQGFKVKALTAGTVTFNNCMRVGTGNNQFLRTTSTPIVDRYKLNLVAANGEGSQILVAYSSETTLAYDRMYDAEILSVSGSQLYSILEGTNKQLTINARPSFENSDVVNLGVSKTGTALENFTIAIAEQEGVFTSGSVLIYLHDTLLHAYHNLANGPYAFNTTSTEMNNRFKIVYQDAALNNTDFESNAVTAAIANETLTIVASLPIVNVMVYDISGRLVTEIKGNNQTNVLNSFRFSEGIYIAKIKMNNGTTATRKLINKI